MGVEDESQTEGPSEPPICNHNSCSSSESRLASELALDQPTVAADTSLQSGSSGPSSVISSSTDNASTTTQEEEEDDDASDDDDFNTIEEGTVVNDTESPLPSGDSNDEKKAPATTHEQAQARDPLEAHTVSAAAVCKELGTSIRCVPPNLFLTFPRLPFVSDDSLDMLIIIMCSAMG